MSIAPQRLGLTATPPSDPARSLLRRVGSGQIVYQLGIADLTGTWLADFDLLVVHLGLTRDERARYDADRRIFAEVNRRFQNRRDIPHATWQRIRIRCIPVCWRGHRVECHQRRKRRLLQFTEAKAAAGSVLLERHRDTRGLIFTADYEAAYAIARQHLVMPMTCEISRAARETALSAFRAGRLRSLVSSRTERGDQTIARRRRCHRRGGRRAGRARRACPAHRTIY